MPGNIGKFLQDNTARLLFLGRTQFAKKCEEYLVLKSNSGYFKKEELDRMLAGQLPVFKIAAKR